MGKTTPTLEPSTKQQVAASPKKDKLEGSGEKEVPPPPTRKKAEPLEKQQRQSKSLPPTPQQSKRRVCLPPLPRSSSGSSLRNSNGTTTGSVRNGGTSPSSNGTAAAQLRRRAPPPPPPPPLGGVHLAPESKVASLDFERVINEYSIQATRERLWHVTDSMRRVSRDATTTPPPQETDSLFLLEEGNDDDDDDDDFDCDYDTFDGTTTTTTTASSVPPPPPKRPKKIARRRPKKSLLGYTGRTATRWFLTGATGLLTGLTAIFIVHYTGVLIDFREAFLHDMNGEAPAAWFLIYTLYNLALALLSSFLSLKLAPDAIGSGIPEIKAYLNGVRVKRFTDLKLFVVKIVATVLSVSSGLVVGPEGPLVHVGAIVGASMTKLGPTLYNWRVCVPWVVSDLSHFSTDAERRDFISTGAAAGFASAFGAPIGGLLFSLEEASTFFAHELLWKTLTGTAIATFCIAIYHGDLARYSIINLVLNTPNHMILLHRFVEMPLYVVVGACGGLLGGFFVFFWKFMQVWRKKVMGSLSPERVVYARLLEVAVLSFITSALMFWLPYVPWECETQYQASPVGPTAVSGLHNFNCVNGRVNQMGTIFIGSRVSAITYILQDPALIDPRTLLLVGLVCYFLLLLTMGVALPTGIFLPSILTGASLGGFFGYVVQNYLLSSSSPSIFALLGAAALLAGIQRSTVSLCVILVEGTGQIKALIPVIITVMVARYVADRITHGGLYEIGMELNDYPFLDHHVKKTLDMIPVSSIMSYPPMTLGKLERAHTVERLLRESSHHGFPVVDKKNNSLVGLVRRDQLVALLEYGIFEDDKKHQTGTPGLSESPLMNLAYHIKDDRYEDVIYDQSALSDNDFDEHSWLIDVVHRRTGFDGIDSLPPSEHPMEEEKEQFCRVGVRDDGTLVATLDPQYARKYVNVAAVMNRGTYCVTESCPVSKAYAMFTSLGLRHLIVLGGNTGGRVVGVVTRSNLSQEFMQERSGYEM